MNDTANSVAPRKKGTSAPSGAPDIPGSSSSHARYNDNAANAPPVTMPINATLNASLPAERRWKIPVAATRDSQDRTILALHADAPRRACLCDDEIHATVQGLTNSPLDRGTYPLARTQVTRTTRPYSPHLTPSA
jgi:hypothetical protein